MGGGGEEGAAENTRLLQCARVRILKVMPWPVYTHPFPSNQIAPVPDIFFGGREGAGGRGALLWTRLAMPYPG